MAVNVVPEPNRNPPRPRAEVTRSSTRRPAGARRSRDATSPGVRATTAAPQANAASMSSSEIDGPVSVIRDGGKPARTAVRSASTPPAKQPSPAEAIHPARPGLRPAFAL